MFQLLVLFINVFLMSLKEEAVLAVYLACFIATSKVVKSAARQIEKIVQLLYLR